MSPAARSTVSRRSLLAAAVGFGAAAFALPDLVDGLHSVDAASPSPAAAPGGVIGRVEIVAPVRLVDSRIGVGVAGRVVPNTDTTVTVAGQPSGTIAVWVNLTVVRPDAAGWAAVWGAGAWPGTSSINFPAGTNRAVLALVAVSPAGQLQIRSSVGTDVVCDIVAVVVQADVAAAGRVQTVPQVRIADTRKGLAGGVFGAGEWRHIPVPTALRTAAGVMVTATGISAGGYWTVAGKPSEGAPSTSTLNPPTTAAATTNQTLATVDADGGLWVYSSRGGHAVLDVVATITGPTAPRTTTGLVQMLPAPRRLLDTRDPNLSPWAHAREIFGGQYVTVAAGRSLPAGSTAMIGSVVAVRPATSGYVSHGQAGAATITTHETDTVAGHALITLGATGLLEIGASAATHVVCDAVAALTGTGWATPSEPLQLGVSGRPMPAIDWANARLTIPAIGFSKPCGDGVTGPVIDAGNAGVVGASGLGNTRTATAIGAHRSSHGGALRRIRDIVPGSEIVFTDGRRTVRWTAVSQLLIPERDLGGWMPQVAPYGTNPEQLVLFACAGAAGEPGPETHRWLIIANLTSVTH